MFAPDAVVAHDNQLALTIELLNPSGCLTERAEDGPCDMRPRVFVGFTHIDELHGSLGLALLLDIKNIHVAVVHRVACLPLWQAV